MEPIRGKADQGRYRSVQSDAQIGEHGRFETNAYTVIIETTPTLDSLLQLQLRARIASIVRPNSADSGVEWTPPRADS